MFDLKIGDNFNRLTNIELLRIVAMFLIVSYHIVFHLGITGGNVNNIYNKSLLNFLMFNGKLGVNIFMIISGYFLINSNFKAHKILKLFINTSICSFTIFLLMNFSNDTLSINDFIKSIFPIFFNTYWFMTSYFVIYLLINYINMFLAALTKRKFAILLIILTCILSVLPSFLHVNLIGENNFLWLLYLYFIGAYIKLFYFKSESKIKCLLIAISFYFIAVATSFTFQCLGIKYNIFLQNQYFFAKQYSFFLLISSIYIFLMFKNISIKPINFVNFYSSSMIGVYLIHDNYLLRDYLNFNIFKNNIYINSSTFVFRILLSIIIVFVLSSIITLIYKATMGKIVEKISRKVIFYLKDTRLFKYIYGKIVVER